MRTASLTKLSPRHGFSLTEMAVVLGVIAAILASIFTVVPQIMQRKHATEAVEDLAILVNNIRNSFNGTPGVPRIGSAALGARLVQANVIPTYMVRNPATGCTNTGAACPDGPWGPYANDGSIDAIGSLHICDWDTTMTSCGSGSSGTSQLFAVLFEGLDKGSCVRLAMLGSLPSGPAGLLDVNINGTNLRQLGAGHGFPVTTTDASAYCITTTGNTVRFIYRLRNGGL